MSKLSPSNNNNIVLVGHMGSGKSTLGSYLAKKIGYTFVDVDEAIVNFIGMTINEFFLSHGEKKFRVIEENVISEILDKEKNNSIIAFGGGAFQSQKTRFKVIKLCTSIWLKCDLKVLALRCSRKKNRPLLQNKDINITLRELNKIRAENFSKSDYVFDVTKKTKSKLTKEIIDKLNINENNKTKK